MAEKRESSVLFSLRELRQLEDDRVKTEQDELAARLAAEKQAKEDAERRAREDEERKRQDEENKVRAEAERKEAADREERIRIAETERRAQVEAQMQLEQQRLHLDHQVKLASAPTKSHKALYAIIGVMTLLVVGLGVAYYVHKKHADEEAQRARDEIAALQKSVDDAIDKQAQFNKDIDALQGKLATADAAERQKIQAEIDRKKADAAANERELNATREKLRSHGGGGGGGGAKKPKGPGLDLNVDTKNSTGGITGH
jgi:colicin import membrane protein